MTGWLATESLLLAAAAGAIVCLAGLVKGAMGLGMAMLAVPMLSLVLPPGQAIGLMVVPVLLSNLVQVAEHGTPVASLKRFGGLIVVQLLASVTTVRLVAGVPQEQTRVLFACAILFAVLLMALRPGTQIRPAQERWSGMAAGLLAGVMGGISSLTSPVLVSYLMALKLKREEFIGSISVIYLCGGVVMYGSMLWFGRFGLFDLALSCLTVLPMALGLVLGKRVRHRFSEAAFRRLLLAFLTGLAVFLLLG